jgi:hypothetical protein
MRSTIVNYRLFDSILIIKKIVIYQEKVVSKRVYVFGILLFSKSILKYSE